MNASVSFFMLLFLLTGQVCIAQDFDSHFVGNGNRDTGVVLRDTARPDEARLQPSGVVRSREIDSLAATDSAYQIDTTRANVLPAIPDSIEKRWNTTNKMLLLNPWINTTDSAVYYLQSAKNFSGKEFIFYLICAILLLLGIFKTFYRTYFNNLFQIFFNTSLRQKQLTDQLSQAQLPSFMLNLFFVVAMGVYIWLLFTHFNKVPLDPYVLLPVSILLVGAIYLVKYLVLKFTGWIAGIPSTVNNYVFVIFLVNKIAGILMIPFIILLAFSQPGWTPFIAIVSGLLVCLLFLTRYFRSFSVIESDLRMNSFHLFIFVVGAEVFPLLILYKIVIDYLL